VSNCYLTQSAILVDRKLGLVRIYKALLRDIGNPTHIALDANNRSIKITRSNDSNPQSHYVEKKIINKRSPEIFDSKFVQYIYSQNEHWDTERAYFIYGDVSSNGKRAEFKFADSVVSHRKVTQKSKPHPVLAIKETPLYSPDASVESLIYTAPSWISTIERTALNADYNAITFSARSNLKQILDELSKTAQAAIDIMEETGHG